MHLLQFFAALIVVLLIGYWLFLLYDLKKYHQQLARISEIETNKSRDPFADPRPRFKSDRFVKQSDT